MAKGGAPVGNQNARKGAMMRKLIEQVLDEEIPFDGGPGAPKTERKKRKLVRKLVDLALSGDLAAIREVLDRVDGKPAQSVIVDGDGEGGDIRTHLKIEFVEHGTGNDQVSS